MNNSLGRAFGFAALLAAPALIVLGVAGFGKADPSVADTGPSISAPAHVQPAR